MVIEFIKKRSDGIDFVEVWARQVVRYSNWCRTHRATRSLGRRGQGREGTYLCGCYVQVDRPAIPRHLITTLHQRKAVDLLTNSHGGQNSVVFREGQ